MEANTVAVVPLRFYAKDIPVPGKPGEFAQEHWVELVKKGSNGATTNEKIARLMKTGKNGYVDPVWGVVKPAYEAWAKGQEEPTSGTPLSQWPAISRAQADHLKGLHLRTVEDVANATDADLERMGMGARSLREKARAYVKAKEGEAVVAEAMAEKDAQIASMAAQLSELTETVRQLTANMPKRAKPKDVAEAA
jgi:hypothetical protein